MYRAIVNRPTLFALTYGQAVIPPVVRALLEPEALVVHDLLRRGRIRECPGPQVDQHDQEDGDHPLQQLLVREFDLVR